MYTMAEKRRIAAGAARSQLRRLGLPLTLDNAERVLDEMATVEPDLVASCWWRSASDRQHKLFRQEWGKSAGWQHTKGEGRWQL